MSAGSVKLAAPENVIWPFSPGGNDADAPAGIPSPTLKTRATAQRVRMVSASPWSIDGRRRTKARRSARPGTDLQIDRGPRGQHRPRRRLLLDDLALLDLRGMLLLGLTERAVGRGDLVLCLLLLLLYDVGDHALALSRERDRLPLGLAIRGRVGGGEVDLVRSIGVHREHVLVARLGAAGEADQRPVGRERGVGFAPRI